MEKQELFALVKRGDAEGLREALAAGGDARARDRFGASLLHRAASRGDLACLELLLAAGAEVDRSSDAGNTPLMTAAARGHLAVVERLIAAGAAPAHRNKWGYDAARWADWAPNADEVKARLFAAADG